MMRGDCVISQMTLVVRSPRINAERKAFFVPLCLRGEKVCEELYFAATSTLAA